MQNAKINQVWDLIENAGFKLKNQRRVFSGKHTIYQGSTDKFSFLTNGHIILVDKKKPFVAKFVYQDGDFVEMKNSVLDVVEKIVAEFESECSGALVNANAGIRYKIDKYGHVVVFPQIETGNKFAYCVQDKLLSLAQKFTKTDKIYSDCGENFCTRYQALLRGEHKLACIMTMRIEKSFFQLKTAKAA